ncbi:MAG TPA: cytochrome c oxidase subunit 3 family protein [Lacipirellulaceae bacterium]
MSATTAHLAHQFDDAEQQFAAAELGMWLFLSTEVLLFGGLFCTYSIYRLWYHAAFVAGSQRLEQVLGTINTAVLLTSSLSMALAVHAAQTDDRRGIVRNLVFTIFLGCMFLGIKGYEYRQKFVEDLVPGPNFSLTADQPNDNSREGRRDKNNRAGQPPYRAPSQTTLTTEPDVGRVELFFSFYFAMTGLHALHMIVGIGMLGVLLVGASHGAFTPEYHTPVEMIGLYWHFVDIVWVFLFPLLYLIR